MTKETAMKILKELHDNSLFSNRIALETLIPELAESNDERIRKCLIDFFEDWHENKSHCFDIAVTAILAWLEKQGDCSAKWEKNTADNKPTLNHSVLMKNIHGIAEGEWNGKEWIQYRWSSNIKDSDVLAWMELSDLDEQCEQKPVGKPKLKFKVGDMVCKKKDNSFCATINSITDTVYLCDVFDSDGDYDDDYAFLVSEQDEYELVAKKIEDEIEIPFGAKDSELQEETYFIPKGFHAEIDDDKVVIKKGEKSTTWSDEDERMKENIEEALDCYESMVSEDWEKEKEWLKRIKDRIGG